MKVKATFRHVFEVTRDVEIDEEEFTAWAKRRYGHGFDTELAAAAWIDAQDTEVLAEVFADFRTSEPLPSDFELRYSECEDARIPTPATTTGDESND